MSGCAPFGVFARKSTPDVPPVIGGELVPLRQEGDQLPSNRRRINVVFVAHNFSDASQVPQAPGARQVGAPRFSHERAMELARSIIRDERPEARGILESSPFDRHAADFQFWYWRPARESVLERSAAEMCSAAGPVDPVDDAIENELQALGMGNVILMNLLNTECRPQGSWFAISGASGLESDPAAVVFETVDLEGIWADLVRDLNPDRLTDIGWLKATILRHVDYQRLAGRFFRRFQSPRTYLSIPSAVVAGERPLSAGEVATAGRHEFGHTFGLWDLYQEDLSSKGERGAAFSRFLGRLNRDYDLVEITGVKERLESFGKTLGVSWEIPEVNVNLLELLIRRPEVAEALGEPLGFPHCARTPEEGRAWAKGLGITVPELYFGEKGCLYFGSDPDKGPNLFYRSSDSVMLRSSSPEADFDPIETAWIERQIARRIGK